MRPYIANIRINLQLTMRDKMALFFNYLFPLIFFFLFGQIFNAGQGAVIAQVVSSVLIIGVLGTGLFGAGMRAVQEREANILRRFKVAPISATPLLAASMVTGVLLYIPSVVLILALSHFVYGMPVPARLFSLLLFVSLGVLALRAVGLILAAVVNSMGEAQVLVQLFYLPMLFLSGATFPVSSMPTWAQIVSHFMPAAYLFTGMQGILLRDETLFQNASSVVALLLTTMVATFIATKLFRWEKDEKIKASSKLWLLAVLGPFLLLGGYQAYSHDNISKSKILDRDMRRNRNLLIRDARIFTGNGRVIESGGVLIKNGKIAEVYEGKVPDAKELKAEPIEAAGKTLLPGLIDVHVHLSSPGGSYESPADYKPDKAMLRALAAYLFSGITTVKSVGDPIDMVLKTRALIASGEYSGAELLACGPMFTAEGGHGTEMLKYVPQQARSALEQQLLRMPKTAEEARRQVAELKTRGVDGIKGILEAGQAGMLFNRMDVAILRAVAEEARAQHLPLVVHTGEARDVGDALAVGANGIEHGSLRDQIPDELFAKMKSQGVAYDPTLTVVEGFNDFMAGKADPLDRSLVQQVGPSALLSSTRKMLKSPDGAKMRESYTSLHLNMDLGKQNLLRAWKTGVLVVTGSDAGNPLVLHGPTIHRELQLWVEAGVSPAAALQAATYNAARLLGAENRIGSIAKGLDANLLLVDGNPLADISLTERISAVFNRGERVDRSELFDQ